MDACERADGFTADLRFALRYKKNRAGDALAIPVAKQMVDRAASLLQDRCPCGTSLAQIPRLGSG
eukprot:13449483-Alexandrium_andersonii.AAC.1